MLSSYSVGDVKSAYIFPTRKPGSSHFSYSNRRTATSPVDISRFIAISSLLSTQLDLIDLGERRCRVRLDRTAPKLNGL